MRSWWNVSRSPTVFPARLFRGWHHSSRLAGSRWAWAALSRQPSQCATVYPRARYWAHCCTCCTLPMSPSSLPQLVSESISTRMTHNCMATAARLMLWPWQIVSWPPSHESKPGCHPTVWGWTRKKLSLPGSEHRNGCWSVTRFSSEPGHPHSSHLIRSGTWASCWIQSSEWRATSTACVAHVSTSCDVYEQYNTHCHRRHSPVWSTLSYAAGWTIATAHSLARQNTYYVVYSRSWTRRLDSSSASRNTTTFPLPYVNSCIGSQSTLESFLRFVYWFEHVWRVVHRLTCRKCAFLSAPSQAAEVFDRRVEATLSFLRSREGRSGRSELAVGLSLLLVQLCGIDCRMTWESFCTNRTVSSGDSKHFCLAIKFNGASVDPHHWEAPYKWPLLTTN